MKKLLIALLPALAVHAALFYMDQTHLSQVVWAGFLLAVLLLGGLLSAFLLIQNLREKNVERSPLLLGGIGLVLTLVYVFVFALSGGLLAVILGL